MDESIVRSSAQEHGDAVVAGDFATAGRTLTPESTDQAPAVMKALPRPLTAAKVESVEPQDDGFVARIRYSNDTDATVVASTWASVDGAARIVDLEVL
ncbi:MAG: hypothetical protein GEU71_10460 [Actinobacteria bacterium]|nr:hypothetical protein [Actinomycetota bacterium]